MGSQVFSFGRLSDFLKVVQSHKNLLSEYGIDHEKAMADMRLLSLGLLASDYEEIPYSEISKTLQVPEVRRGAVSQLLETWSRIVLQMRDKSSWGPLPVVRMRSRCGS